jgi:hypothetical protein
MEYENVEFIYVAQYWAFVNTLMNMKLFDLPSDCSICKKGKK